MSNDVLGAITRMWDVHCETCDRPIVETEDQPVYHAECAPPTNVDAMADAVHRVLCGPFATVDPKQCVYTRDRDVAVAEALIRDYRHALGATDVKGEA